MIRRYWIVMTALVLTACSTHTSSKKSNIDTVKALATMHSGESLPANILADTTKVKSWLTEVMEKYANSQNEHAIDSLKQSLTAGYYNYKQDAIDLEYDNGDSILTPEAFKKKWKSKYDTRLVGNGGFIISAQDNGKIKVKTVNFIKSIGQNVSLYKVVIEDLDYKTMFNRDFKIIKQKNKLLIDDIMEYN